MKEVKSGYKTTEFWFTTLAQLIGILFASGVVGEGTLLAQALGIATTVLSTIGYQVSRGIAKK